MTRIERRKVAAYHCDRALRHMKSNNLVRAETLLRQAIDCDPESGVLFYNLGFCLHLQDKFEESDESYKKACDLEPNNPHFWCNRGRNFYEWGQYELAEDCYEKGIKIDPNHLLLFYNLGELRLHLGDFETGFAYYEARPPVGMKAVDPRYNKPRWWGESGEGKTILVHAEQGLGDTMQFIRYVRMLENECGFKVISEVQKQLVSLLSETFIDLFTYDDVLPEFDYQIPLMSIPGILTQYVEDIPGEVGYIKANPELVDYWKDYFQGLNKIKIGVNWKGRGGEAPQAYPGIKIYTGMMAARDIPVELFQPLVGTPGVSPFVLVNLQKDILQNGMINPSAELKEYDAQSFMDTAAVMMSMDLVITNDTSIAHLAGAMGVPVWVCLPYVANWRWLLDRHDSPWYPSMRLFRQRYRGCWGQVFSDIESALRKEFQC